MAALTEDAVRSRMTARHIELVAFPIAAGAVIYAGSAVCLDAQNFLVPASDQAGLKPVGVAHRGLDNTGGEAGSYGPPSVRLVPVDVASIYLFEIADPGLGQAPVYALPAFIVDDNQVSSIPTAESLKLGEFVRPFEGDPLLWFVDLRRR